MKIQNYLLFVGPGQTGTINLNKAKDVLRKHGIIPNVKEIELMRWGDENHPGQIIEIEIEPRLVDQLIDELCCSLNTEYVGLFNADDFKD